MNKYITNQMIGTILLEINSILICISGNLHQTIFMGQLWNIDILYLWEGAMTDLIVFTFFILIYLYLGATIEYFYIKVVA